MNEQEATSGMPRLKEIDLSTLLGSCRICMARNINMSAIFDTDSVHIIEEILFCTGVTLTQEDGLPTKICTQCLKDLSVAYKFKTSCLLADETFRKLIVEANIKTEALDASDDFEEVIGYEDELVDVDKKVKSEPKTKPISNVQNGRTLRVSRIIKSTESKKVRRIGRPKNPNAPPRRLKKYKFKKLHCESCDIKFDNKQQCEEHKKDKHKESAHWVCEICGKLFVHRASHYSHIKSHMPPKYACDQCDYKTWHKYDLVKHIRIHTGVKMYQCEYCTASYYTSSNLTGHIRRNHMKQRPFQCHLCRMTFFDRTKLNRHVDSHNEIKRFECEVCHSCFTRRCYWKKHLQRQHDIITPPKRPGRQKTNAVIGVDLLEKTIPSVTPAVKNFDVLTEYLVMKTDKEL